MADLLTMNAREKAFASAADTTKQLITLASAILGLTITFREKIVHAETGWTWLISAAWIAYLLSILAGIWTLLALTGELEPEKATDGSDAHVPSIRGTNVKLPALVQILIFLVGTGMVVGYAVFTM